MVNYIVFSPTYLNWVLTLGYTVLTIIGIYFFRNYKRLNPIVWFSIFQWLIASGSILLVDLNIESHRFYVLLFFIAYLTYISSALFLWHHSKISLKYSEFWRKEVNIDTFDIKFIVISIFLLSVGVTIFYYTKVGYNVFLNIILGVTIEDYATLRLQTYSGDDYFAPGYVNQFKNVLLPVTLSIICAWNFLEKKKKTFYIYLIFGSMFCVVALLGTGQRAFFAYSVVALFFGIVAFKDLKWRSIVVPSILLFSLFTLMSSFYKFDAMDQNENIILESTSQSLERFFYTEQEGALKSFEYLYSQDKAYMTETLQQIRGMIPGQKGSFLEHYLFSLRHGTTRGTETYATAAGFYYNGGLSAVILFFLFLAFFHFYIFYSFLGGERTVTRIFIYAAIIFYTSKIVSGGILTVINSGVLTLAILLLLTKIKLNLNNIFISNK